MRYFIQSLKFFFFKRILGRKFLTATDTIFNLNFHVEIHDAMGRKIFKRGSLHPDHTSFLLTLPFDDSDVILDIGANIGWYSIVLKNNIRRNVTFYAFEPEPLNFELLKKNIAHNHIANIEAVNKAVAEKSGQSTLFLYHPKNSGRHSLLDINPQTNKSIQVETINLEDFLKGKNIDFKKVKLIKIDIEGYEVFALKNAATLLQQLPYMFIEYSPVLIRQGGQDPAHFIKWLSDFGFNFYNIEGGKPSTRSVEFLTTLDYTE
ncbi:MAG TPA: FkbM family methyltransferase, partial [Chryseolinea sp.]|nr:FkbM family methyltransferase [Chryseolinea sp.]